MQLQAAGRKSCRVLNPVELFTMTFQADSKWQDLTPSKLKQQYEKDKKAGEGMDLKMATRFYASLADKYSAPSRFTYCKKVLLFEEGKTVVLQSKGDVLEWKTLCEEMMNKLKADNRERAVDLYNGMNPHDANDDSVARGGVRNLLLCKKAMERMIKYGKPLEDCERQEAKLAWRELMVDIGQMMIVSGANVARAMDAGPYDDFYNPCAAVARIMDDFYNPWGDDLAEHFLDTYGVAHPKAFRAPDDTVPMTVDDDAWLEQITKEYCHDPGWSEGEDEENLVVLEGVLEVVDGGVVEKAK